MEFEQLPNAAIVHNVTIWQCRLVPEAEVRDGSAPELKDGFRAVPHSDLTADERARCLMQFVHYMLDAVLPATCLTHGNTGMRIKRK